jgi:hypothetical protein
MSSSTVRKALFVEQRELRMMRLPRAVEDFFVIAAENVASGVVESGMIIAFAVTATFAATLPCRMGVSRQLPLGRTRSGVSLTFKFIINLN